MNLTKKEKQTNVVSALKQGIKKAFGKASYSFIEKIKKLPENDNRIKAFAVVGELLKLEAAVKKNPELKQDKRISDFITYMESKESRELSKQLSQLLFYRNPPDIAGVWLTKMHIKLDQNVSGTTESQSWVSRFLELTQ